jgi:hypothetical protein
VGLVLKADVKPAVVFDRQSVTLRVALGKTAEQEVRLVGARASEVQLGRPRVELLAPDSASSRPLADGTTLRIDKLPAAAHKAAGLRLRFTGRITGTQSGRIVIPTGIDHPAEVDLALTLSVAAKT